MYETRVYTGGFDESTARPRICTRKQEEEAKVCHPNQEIVSSYVFTHKLDFGLQREEHGCLRKTQK